jgi:putative nucleotidyltransferase with HDIG domain
MRHSTLNQIALQEKTRREILNKSDLIPPLPELVTRLLGALNRPETEPQDLGRLLQNDQVLVARMLAMVNSPFYGLNRTIHSIKDAVMVLGFRGVRSLVLASSTAKFMMRDFACYGHPPKGLWLHAVSVAAGARALAQHCRLGADDCERLFVAGLLHDIGKLVLAPYLCEAVGSRPPSGPIVEYERSKIGLDHTEAGALVTAKWNIAAEVQEVIKQHHETCSAEDDKRAAVVRLADAVAHELGIGYLDAAKPVANVLAADIGALGLTDQSWLTVRDELAATMADAARTLGNLGC